MDLREATYDEVEETLRDPFSIRPAKKRRHNYYRAIGAFSIRVTVMQRSRIIVTVWKEPL